MLEAFFSIKLRLFLSFAGDGKKRRLLGSWSLTDSNGFVGRKSDLAFQTPVCEWNLYPSVSQEMHHSIQSASVVRLGSDKPISCIHKSASGFGVLKHLFLKTLQHIAGSRQRAAAKRFAGYHPL